MSERSLPNGLTAEKFEMIKTIFEQNFLHARHVTLERHWFTNIYILVVAGASTFLSLSESAQFLGPVLLSLLVFSLLGIFISLKLGAELANLHKVNERLMGKYFEALKCYLGVPLKGRYWSFFRLRYMYPLIFSSTSGIWIMLLLNSDSNTVQLAFSACVGLFVGIFLDVLLYDP